MPFGNEMALGYYFKFLNSITVAPNSLFLCSCNEFIPKFRVRQVNQAFGSLPYRFSFQVKFAIFSHYVMCYRAGVMTIQYLAASIVLLIVAPLAEDMTIIWETELILSIAWLTIMCSVGSYILLFYLTRIGSATKVSSLIYLTPPVAMIMAYFLFGEALGVFGILGTLVVITGVIFVNYATSSTINEL